MTRWTTLGLVLTVCLTGCSAVSFGDSASQKEAPVKIVNNATLTETFEVAVVEVGENMTIYRGSRSQNIPVSSGSTTFKSPLSRVDLPDSARVHGQYTLEPGERKELSVPNVRPDEAIVILIYDEEEERYRAIKSLSCDGPVLGYKVTTEAEGEDETMSTHQCGL
ncbi:hypothetical protein [Halogranum rubrum]|uniref:hypothetical protein n=1 Tax=Halogranum rubrum TaxID=553466 RepID=UPI00116063F0|nr:hypothetical protein [Halogranum rubrum]